VIEDYLVNNGVAFMRGITLVVDNESEVIGAVLPELLPGQRDSDEYSFPFDHPGTRMHKQVVGPQ
jgi:hypothetical protein